MKLQIVLMRDIMRNYARPCVKLNDLGFSFQFLRKRTMF